MTIINTWEQKFKLECTYLYDILDRRCFNDLDDAEKEKLTGLLMMSEKEWSRWEYISDADEKSEVPDLLTKYLLAVDKKEEGINLLEKLSDNACRMAKSAIDDFFERYHEEMEMWRKYPEEEPDMEKDCISYFGNKTQGDLNANINA